MLGAEQSGFIADLGYETYQKILAEAVTELKNDEFADLYADEIKAGEEKFSGEEFVDECQVESDLELLFPNEYIPSSSERMLLYRELDKLVLDQDVEAFKARLVDRFGKIPPEGEELIRIVPLRRLAKRLGVEKVMLKAGKMILYFVSNLESPYYQSQAFGKFIAICFMAVKPLLFLLAPGLSGLLLVQPVQLLGYGLFTPASVYYANANVSPVDQVKGQSIMMIASNGLGAMFGNFLAGYAIDWDNWLRMKSASWRTIGSVSAYWRR